MPFETTSFSAEKTNYYSHISLSCRASALMHELRTAQTATPLPFPKFKPGDALEVHMLPYKSAEKPVSWQKLSSSSTCLCIHVYGILIMLVFLHVCFFNQQIIRGVVLAKANRGIDTSFILRDVTTPYTPPPPLSPLMFNLSIGVIW